MEQLFEIGDVIRKLRLTKKKMSILTFARFAGLNKGTISKAEKGKNIEKETLEKIAKAFGKTVGDLYAYIPQQNDQGITTERQDLPYGIPEKRRRRTLG